jgi:multiple sugar transport system ATP-binding protein
VALGRAMVRRPQVFLMDEPLTNLDAALRADMRAELKHLQQELATTMVYVTHDQVEAMSMSHRIAVMNLGVLQQVGTPLEVYRRPATLFVAGFIGTPPMRLIGCTLAGNELVDGAGGFRLKVGADAAETLRASKATQLVLGIRPEEVAIAADGTADFTGTVTLREPLGDETIYDLQVGEQTLQLRAPPTLRLAIGEQVPLTVDRTALRVFDRASEQAIV